MATAGTADESRTRERSECARPVIAYLGLGSNLGERETNLADALVRLGQTPGIRVLRSTPFRPSAPWGDVKQPEFLNSVAEIATTLAPLDLLRAAKRIEGELGRLPARRWGPRLIDIDLLIYADMRLATSELTLPHPFILERPFVYEPLAELAPAVLEALRRDAALPV